MVAALTVAQVLSLASQHPAWDPQWVAWQVFDAGTGNGESSGRPDIVSANGKYVGLLQIDWKLHGLTIAQLQDPGTNIAEGYKLFLQSGTAPWPSAKNYPGKVTAMADGVCPFAQQIGGGLDKAPNAGGFYDMVGICDHAAGGFYTTLMDPGFWQSTGVSVNFAIARDGRIGQILNLFTAPYGQGKDQDGRSIDASSRGISWPHWAEMGRRNPNVFMVAVEHEDWQLVSGVSHAVTGSEWTLAQYNADLKLKRWMVDEVKRVQGRNLLRFGIDSLADHHMFDPVNRSNCAGPFWRNNYRPQLYADLTGDDEMFTVLSNGGKVSAQAADDYTFDLKAIGLPASAKRCRLQVWNNGAPLELYHGLPDTNNRDAGRVYQPYSIIEVVPSQDGKCYIGPPGALFDIQVLGYFS